MSVHFKTVGGYWMSSNTSLIDLTLWGNRWETGPARSLDFPLADPCVGCGLGLGLQTGGQGGCLPRPPRRRHAQARPPAHLTFWCRLT